jgi:hypothetical protein
LTDLPRDDTAGSSDIEDLQFNIDHFYHHPTHHLVGVLTEKSEIPVIRGELESAGVDTLAVEILCGERGAAILDQHGRYHGLRGRIVRTVQRLGYDQETLETYDAALRHGDLLLRVPAPPADRYRIAALLQCHQVHHIGYFGREWFEQIPLLDDPEVPTGGKGSTSAGTGTPSPPRSSPRK